MRMASTKSVATPFWKKGLVALLLFHVFALVLLSASPSLHERIHHDCNSTDHDCAVTAVLSGQIHVPDEGLITIATPIKEVVTSFVSETRWQWPRSFFLDCRILEHAPPFSI
jgi:hypothetical protein